jgi:hypothetical protein
MVMMKSGLAAFCVAAVAAAVLSAPAGAQTPNRLTTCNAEWNAMKANGTVGDKKYADFRKDCLARLANPEAAPAPGATPAAPPAAAPGTAAAPPPASAPPPAAAPHTASPGPAPHTAAPAAPTAPAAPGQAVFPTAVSPKYANETAGKARMHTCLDQYHANKATGGNGGLNWIQRGGGYYSECNKRLKG